MSAMYVDLICPACGEAFMCRMSSTFGKARDGRVPITLRPDEGHLARVSEHIAVEHPLWPDDPGMLPDNPVVER